MYRGSQPKKFAKDFFFETLECDITFSTYSDVSDSDAARSCLMQVSEAYRKLHDETRSGIRDSSKWRQSDVSNICAGHVK